MPCGQPREAPWPRPRGLLPAAGLLTLAFGIGPFYRFVKVSASKIFFQLLTVFTDELLNTATT